MRAVSSREMREIDRRSAEEFGIPAETLMENAGAAVARETLDLLKLSSPPWKAAVLCGGGNNGGDGLAAARLLHRETVVVSVVLLKPHESLQGAAASNFARMKSEGVPWTESPAGERLRAILEQSQVAVDALLGTGFRGPLKKEFADAIEALNACGRPVIAVDVPSGLDADTGRPGGPCVRAAATVTMGAPKTGFLEPSAGEWLGRLVVADIGFPPELLK